MPRQTALVGREYDIGLMRGLVERVRDKGGAMVVRGEAGIGKSALLMDASRAASAAGVRVRSAAGAVIPALRSQRSLGAARGRPYGSRWRATLSRH